MKRPWATYDRGKAITDRQLAKLLKPFEIISETVHPNETGEPKAKGYRRERFEDAFSRYLTLPDGGQNDASRQIEGAQAYERANADETGTTDTFCERAENNLHAHEKREKSASHAGSHACTDKNSKTDGETPFDHHSAGNGTAKFRSDIADAYEELKLRAGPICAHCGRPVDGEPWDYDGIKVWLHSHCERPWIETYEASDNRPLAFMRSSQ
jgi:hypothetical protein